MVARRDSKKRKYENRNEEQEIMKTVHFEKSKQSNDLDVAFGSHEDEKFHDLIHNDQNGIRVHSAYAVHEFQNVAYKTMIDGYK